MTPSLDDVRQVLRVLAPPAIPTVAPAGPRAAAVAAVCREAAAGGAGVDLLFIRRAEHPLDPWSGHMALPGGRIDPGDPDPLAAAMRETAEEVGLDLAGDAALLGPLSPLEIPARTGRPGMRIHPFAFELRGDRPLRANHEVEETLWVPLNYLLRAENRSRLLWNGAGAPLELPCCTYEGRTIWGITLRIVDELVEALRRHLAAGSER